jgi:DNA topoisomerase-1
MVGYRISPLLWAKIKRGLSAGRVQSVALRIICDREDEINAFIPEEYWSLDAILNVKGEKKPVTAKYYGKAGKGKNALSGEKVEIRTKAEADAIMKELKKASFQVAEVKKGERLKKAPLPFTTSTLQQEASKVLNFSTVKTMRIAQQLYEGIDLKGNGTVGLITYLRTDSTRVSEEAAAAAAAYIAGEFGDNYQGTQENRKTETRIQDAHEAIRPSDVTRTPAAVKDSLTRDQLRLYTLIWKRFMASRMSAALYENTRVTVEAAGKKQTHQFAMSYTRLLFDGFMRVYDPGEDEASDGQLSAKLDEGEKLALKEILPKQHFTEPPAHYTEASLVRAMEERGIGRPSTYAPTISTILARHYITKDGRNLYMTELGDAVNNIMVSQFQAIVNPDFTAGLETLLDDVADGDVRWKTIIENFYPDLDEAVKEAEQKLPEVKVADEVSEEICELCGRNMVIKYGPHGRFLACPGFPECRNTKPYYEKIGVECPNCGKDLVVKMTRKGRRYFGCTGYPDCDFMVWDKPSAQKCPECGGMMLEKGGKLVCMNAECGHVENRKKETV